MHAPSHSCRGQAHRRHPTVESYASRPHPEPVILDIGGPLGALIVHTDPHMVGVEIEISAAARDHDRAHKEVLEREISGRPAYTAVFDKLEHGVYTLWVDDLARARGVTISGGAVSELDWSSRAS